MLTADVVSWSQETRSVYRVKSSTLNRTRFSSNLAMAGLSVCLSVCMSVCLCWLATLQAISDPYCQTLCLWLCLSADRLS